MWVTKLSYKNAVSNFKKLYVHTTTLTDKSIYKSLEDSGVCILELSGTHVLLYSTASYVYSIFHTGVI